MIEVDIFGFDRRPVGASYKMAWGVDPAIGDSRTVFITYYKRADMDWHRDQRRDEDPRHQFKYAVAGTAGAICGRCGLYARSTEVVCDGERREAR